MITPVYDSGKARKIGFRAWNILLQEMCEVICLNLRDICPDHILLRKDGADYNARKEKLVLMQFTGLLDKKGKEIYEGDIVQTFDTLQVSAENRKQCVHWSNYAAAFVPFGFHAYAVRQAYNDKKEVTADCEVIGNIYEHPELLEAK